MNPPTVGVPWFGSGFTGGKEPYERNDHRSVDESVTSAHTPDHVTVSAADVGAVAAAILDPERVTPLLVVTVETATQQPRVPTHLLTGLGVPVVALKDIPTSYDLNRLLPDNVKVYGGAVRMFMPRITPNDSSYQHPLYATYPHLDPHDVAAEISEDLQRSNSLIATSPPTPTPAPAPTPPPDPATPEQSGVLDALTELITAVQALPAAVDHATRAAVTDILGDPTQPTVDLVAALTHALRDAHQRYQGLLTDHQAITQVAGQQWPPKVHDDPETQFRYEIEQCWLTTYTPTARADHGTLRGFSVAEGFLASLDQDIIDRRKTLIVCVEVLTRDVHARRATHPYWTARGSGVARTRPDGATAWRAALRTHSPGAPRLTWWEVPDGTVEFTRASHHDVMLDT